MRKQIIPERPALNLQASSATCERRFHADGSVNGPAKLYSIAQIEVAFEASLGVSTVNVEKQSGHFCLTRPARLKQPISTSRLLEPFRTYFERVRRRKP